MNKLNIEFLYLDLNICERCIGTDDTLDEALNILTPVLNSMDYSVNITKVNIATKELAEQYQFISSPTIRVNGIDICDELKESDCKHCGDLCGTTADCRVFVYHGEEYEQPPVAAIIDGILRVIYGNKSNEKKEYILPENLKKYFRGREEIMNKLEIFEPAMCCSTGLCGVDVDEELLRVSTIIGDLQNKGASIARYNLSSAPNMFVKNKIVNEELNKYGTKVLPITLLNGEVTKKEGYPTNEELSEWSGLEFDNTDKKNSSGGCGCSGGDCC